MKRHEYEAAGPLEVLAAIETNCSLDWQRLVAARLGLDAARIGRPGALSYQAAEMMGVLSETVALIIGIGGSLVCVTGAVFGHSLQAVALATMGLLPVATAGFLAMLLMRHVIGWRLAAIARKTVPWHVIVTEADRRWGADYFGSSAPILRLSRPYQHLWPTDIEDSTPTRPLKSVEV